MDNETIIKIEDIAKTNGKEIIFKNVSFEIKKHEFISLKGPSGCGKTTFLRILSVLTAPPSGKIFLKMFPLRLKNTSLFLLRGHQVVEKQHFYVSFQV